MMKTHWNGKLFALVYALLLTAFTLYAALDTFVIPRKLTQAESVAAKVTESAVTPPVTESISADQAKTASEEDAIATDDDAVQNDTIDAGLTNTLDIDGEVIGTYTDDHISITITSCRVFDSTVYVADIALSDLSFLQRAFAGDTYGRNIKAETSEIASENDAILAINGDFYGARNEGYVIRDGVLYRNTPSRGQEDLVIMEDGTFRIINESDVSAETLLEEGARELLSFGPALLLDQEIQVTVGEEVGRAKASNPRTAIGIYDDLHYVFVVSDGRTDESAGLSLYQLAEFLQSIGVTCAYNLDGGGSSTMVFQDTLINHPTTRGSRVSERDVSDIVYISAK